MRNRTAKALAGLVALAAGVSGLAAATSQASTTAEFSASMVAKDYYSRADGTTWGWSTIGGKYKYAGQVSAFNITGGKAMVTGLKPGAAAEAYLDAVSVADTQIQSVVTIPATDIGQQQFHATVEARRTVDGSSYRGRLQIYKGGSAVVALSRTNGKAETGLGSFALPFSVSAGQDIFVVLRVTGTNPVSLDVRAWRAGTVEPGWQLTATDSSASRLAGAGYPGVWDYVSSGSAPLSIGHDALVISALTPSTAPATAPATTTSNATTSAPALTTAPSTTTAKPTTPTTTTQATTPTTTSKPPTTTTTTAAPAPIVTGTVYKGSNFDSLPLGQVTDVGFISALGGAQKGTAAYDDMAVVSDPRGGRFLRTTLKANTIHSQPGSDNGDNIFVSLPAQYDSACVQYQLRFDSNFDWSLGGKLPGLEGVAPGVAPSTPSGGNDTNLGWSGRAMWLTPKSYSWAGPVNMGVSYMYHPGQAGTYGDNIAWNKSFVAGTWHTIKQCYRMNTVGQANGVLQAWMDGVRVVDNHSFVYRTRVDIHISHLMFSIFRGGNTMAWAGSRDGYVDVDNMAITSY